MSKDQNRPKIRLKYNDLEFDVRSGLAELRFIRWCVACCPQAFQAMLDMATGHHEQVSADVLAEIKRGGLLEADGLTLREDVRLVLLSATETTPDGPVLSFNPFKLESVNDRIIVEWAQRQNDRSLGKTLGLSPVAREADIRKALGLPNASPFDEQDFRQR